MKLARGISDLDNNVSLCPSYEHKLLFCYPNCGSETVVIRLHSHGVVFVTAWIDLLCWMVWLHMFDYIHPRLSELEYLSVHIGRLLLNEYNYGD